MKRRLLLIFALVLVVGGLLYWRTRPAEGVFWQGYADADYVTIGPVLQGKLTQVLVARGQIVPVGTVLFTQDAIDDQAALAQAQAAEAQAEAQLDNLRQGSKPQEIAAAVANLAAAKAAAFKAHDDLRRNQALVKAGFATRQLVAEEAADARNADAQVASLQAMLDLAEAPTGRDAEIAGQVQQVAALAAAAKQAQWMLDQRTGRAPASGVIADVLAQPGETLDVGAGVISLLPPQNIFIRFFVGETELANIHLGDQVKLVCDSCTPGLTGTISFIKPQAEYTPPVIYSDSQREKLVTEVEARPATAQATLFNPGMPVQVSPIGAAPK
jgi:HlyD family secretion protein